MIHDSLATESNCSGSAAWMVAEEGASFTSIFDGLFQFEGDRKIISYADLDAILMARLPFGH